MGIAIMIVMPFQTQQLGDWLPRRPSLPHKLQLARQLFYRSQSRPEMSSRSIRSRLRQVQGPHFLDVPRQSQQRRTYTLQLPPSRTMQQASTAVFYVADGRLTQVGGNDASCTTTFVDGMSHLEVHNDTFFRKCVVDIMRFLVLFIFLALVMDYWPPPFFETYG